MASLKLARLRGLVKLSGVRSDCRATNTEMTCSDFQRLLRETGSYESDDRPPASAGDRLLGRFDSWYYLRLCAIVFAARTKARRGRYSREEFARSSFDTLLLVEGCRGRVRITGAENLGGIAGGIVVMANHMSLLETFLLPSILLAFNNMTTVVKKPLLSYPLFGTILKASDVVPVSRRDPRRDLRDVLEGGVAALRAGKTLLLFPQATRSAVLRPRELNTLAVKVALRAEVPLAPLALKTDFHGIGRILRDAGRLDRGKKIHFAFGAPLPVRGNGRDAHAQAVDFIVRNFQSWGGCVENE